MMLVHEDAPTRHQRNLFRARRRSLERRMRDVDLTPVLHQDPTLGVGIRTGQSRHHDVVRIEHYDPAHLPSDLEHERLAAIHRPPQLQELLSIDAYGALLDLARRLAP